MYGGLTLMFVSIKQFRLTSKFWCVPLWSSYFKRWAITAPSMWQISSCVSFVSCKILCNAWFHTQATNEFYRNVINNNKITPNKQASIIGSKEWHDEIWSSVLCIQTMWQKLYSTILAVKMFFVFSLLIIQFRRYVIIHNKWNCTTIVLQ